MAVSVKTWFSILLVAVLSASGSALANEALELINQARTKNGLPVFQIQPELESAAKGHSHYMSINQSLGHSQEPDKVGFTGEGGSDRAVAAGYVSRRTAENISYGEPLWVDSAEALLSAIYHRFGFLCFDLDEIGMAVARSAVKPKTAEEPLYYTYLMGSSPVRKVCGLEPASSGNYYHDVCRDREFRVSEARYERANSHLVKSSADMVVYPWYGQTRVSPVFVNNEHPNPLPGMEMTGQPVSVQFNYYRFKDKTITIDDFQLRDQDNNIVPLLPRMDKETDVAGKFTEYEFAWFPEKILRWGTMYKANLQYSIDGESHSREWYFHTKPLPYKKQVIVTSPGQKFKVKAGEEYAIVLAPELTRSRVTGAELGGCIGKPCQVKIKEANVVTVAQRGGTTLKIRLGDGTSYSVYFRAK